MNVLVCHHPRPLDLRSEKFGVNVLYCRICGKRVGYMPESELKKRAAVMTRCKGGAA